MRDYCVILVFINLLAFSGALRAADLNQNPAITITVDGRSPGRVFEGIGALSAGASTRLLPDYPEPQRSGILDLLFKPQFGAALQHLKVEIGGDVNSTCGSEPSHAHTRAEFEHPKPEYFNRGYEWWLMKEARQRNPAILLDTLQWGAPGWIGQGSFFSQDNADFIASFLKGARDYQGLQIQYQGLRNEIAFDAPWTKLLRQTLDKAGLQYVKIVAADQVNDWSVLNHIQNDTAFNEAVAVVGVHYPGYISPAAAKSLNKPLWSSEDGPWRGDWEGARSLAKLYNRNYIQGRMTKTIIWSPITSYYDSLHLPGSGMMKANTPWSGYYEVQPALWATAHTTQFTQPGWMYLDSGCGILDMGGSYVTLKAPDGSGNYSIIIETVDAPYPGFLSARPFTFNVSNDLTTGTVHVWRTSETSQFEKVADIVPVNGSFTFAIEGKTIYTLTTTSGQQKGTPAIPADKPFPFPYSEDFEGCEPDHFPKYVSDQNGSFAVAVRGDGKGKCLRQLSPGKGIEWFIPIDYPQTNVGDGNWTDYEVSVDAHLDGESFASILGRAGQQSGKPTGYEFRLYHDGRWELSQTGTLLDFGRMDLSPAAWYQLRLQFHGAMIAAFVDGKRLTCLSDITYKRGPVGLVCDWKSVEFDNLEVRPLGEGKPDGEQRSATNLSLGAKLASSSDWSPEYSADKANDGNPATRWNVKNGAAAGEWLQLDFGQEVAFDCAVMTQFQDRISAYAIQYWDGTGWKDAYSGQNMGTVRKIDHFPSVKSSKVRLFVTATKESSPSIQEFQVYSIGQ